MLKLVGAAIGGAQVPFSLLAVLVVALAGVRDPRYGDQPARLPDRSARLLDAGGERRGRAGRHRVRGVRLRGGPRSLARRDGRAAARPRHPGSRPARDRAARSTLPRNRSSRRRPAWQGQDDEHHVRRRPGPAHRDTRGDLGCVQGLPVRGVQAGQLRPHDRGRAGGGGDSGDGDRSRDDDGPARVRGPDLCGRAPGHGAVEVVPPRGRPGRLRDPHAHRGPGTDRRRPGPSLPHGCSSSSSLSW